MLDASLGGGWPAASLGELAGRRSTGRTSVLYATLAAALARGQAVALVEAAGAFDPRAAKAAQVPIERLLWIRAGARTVLQAADLLLSAGGFGLIAIDMGERPTRAPDSAWLRLRHAAERQGTSVLVVAPYRLTGATSTAAVVMHGGGPRFVDAGGPLFDALETHIEIERNGRTSPSPANDQTSGLCFHSSTPR